MYKIPAFPAGMGWKDNIFQLFQPEVKKGYFPDFPVFPAKVVTLWLSGRYNQYGGLTLEVIDVLYTRCATPIDFDGNSEADVIAVNIPE